MSKNVQCQACFSLAGATQGTSWKNLYLEFDFVLFGTRGWCRKLVYFYFFYRRLNSLAPKYLTDLSLQTVTSTIQEGIRI